MTASTFIGHFLGPDTHTNRPAVTGLPNGTQYVCTTHQKIERIVSGAWVDYATLGVPAGSGVVATDPIFDAKGDLVAGTAADTAAKVTAGTNGQVLTADSAQTTGVKWATPSAGASGALTLLSTTTIAGSAATFDVSSISGSYNDLVLIGMLRGAITAFSTIGWLRFNNDSTSNYGTQKLDSTVTTTSSTQTSAVGQIDLAFMPAASATANVFAAYEIVIPGYASTAWIKPVMIRLHLGYSPAANDKGLDIITGIWNSTAAINRIQILTNGSPNTFAIGSQLRIYGRL